MGAVLPASSDWNMVRLEKLTVAHLMKNNVQNSEFLYRVHELSKIQLTSSRRVGEHVDLPS
jgi:hypothetical protein